MKFCSASKWTQTQKKASKDFDSKLVHSQQLVFLKMFKKFLINVALLKVALSYQIDHRSYILQAATDRFGVSTVEDFKTHGCWASKLDVDNNSWNGGTRKVDSIDSLFSKWFSACDCLELDGAECANGVVDTTCQTKLDEIDTYYLDLIDAELPSFVVDTSQTCVHPDKSENNNGNNVDNRGGHCQNVVPNYVAPTTTTEA